MSISVIPAPDHFEQGHGRVAFPSKISINCNVLSVVPVAQLAAQTLLERYNISCTVESVGGEKDNTPFVSLHLHTSLQSLDTYPLREEAYEINVSFDTGIVIRALGEQGLFYGVQTFLQLLPVPSGDLQVVDIPIVKIKDAPRFVWRGVLLDVGRHFYTVDFIKKLLDMMAMYKMNRFHWHLTEDQGWRLEIKSHPRLTSFGSWRGQEPYRTGGCYTQDEVQEIVTYASQRFIEVLPEVELPGHCCAALASYPYLSCTEQVTQVPVNWGIHEDVYCAGKEEVFAFLEDVFKEVVQLFPFRYIHIGGDECPRTRWEVCPRCQLRMRQEGLTSEAELQSWFIKRVSSMLEKYHRQIIGWDEILEGGLAEGATVMSWRGTVGGIIAAKAGHDVIMTPTSHCYFDYRQSTSAAEPGAWYACLPLQGVYSYDPIPSAPPRRPRQALGEGLLDTSGVGASGGTQSGAHGMGTQGGLVKEASPVVVTPGGEVDTATLALFHGHIPPVSDPVLPLIAQEAALQEMRRSPSDDSVQEQECGEGEEEELEDEGPQMSAEEREPMDLGPAVLVESPQAPSSPVRLADRSLTPEEAAHVLGSQANLWTEYIGDEDTAEYMLLPRLCALAEVVWTPQQKRDYQDFLTRLTTHCQWFDVLGYKYRPL